MKHTYNIIIPKLLSPPPMQKEISAAFLLMNFFQSDVEFVMRGLHRTADFKICNQLWELKSSTGSGKHNIQHALQNAAHQSGNVILDIRFSKVNSLHVIAEAKHQFRIIRRLKRLLIIEKTEKVIEIFR